MVGLFDPSDDREGQELTSLGELNRLNEDENMFVHADRSLESSEFRIYSPNELLDEIALTSVQGVGSIMFERLVEYFGCARDVLNASLKELERVPKVGSKVAQKILEARNANDSESIANFCEKNEISILTLKDSRYPARLREIPNPPQLLYMRGNFLPEDRRAIAVVGTRKATAYGCEQASRFGRELVEAGFTVISGLALGIDGCAHRAALDAKGRTIAVLGGGAARIFPREHEDLAARIISSGALMSEYHPLMSPLSGNFPARNRIVSGLSIGVLVVESPSKSGSLITAEFAAEQNREIFAIPGRVDSPFSRGCHDLIRDGAALVESVDDVIAALPDYERVEIVPRRQGTRRNEATAPGTAGLLKSSLESISRRPAATQKRDSNIRTTRETQRNVTFDAKTPVPQLPPLSEDEQKLVDAIGTDAMPIDLVIRQTGLPASRTIGLISCLEIKGVLCRREGNSVARRM